MKTADLVRNIKLRIRELQEIGLKVVSTVCDQMSTNCSAINTLISDTMAESLRRNEEPRTLGFKINNEEVIPLYDPPHMLKHIRNHLFENNATFTIDGQQYTASWEDIKKFYVFDNENDIMRVCHRLTDQHIYQDKLKKNENETYRPSALSFSGCCH